MSSKPAPNPEQPTLNALAARIIRYQPDPQCKQSKAQCFALDWEEALIDKVIGADPKANAAFIHALFEKYGCKSQQAGVSLAFPDGSALILAVKDPTIKDPVQTHTWMVVDNGIKCENDCYNHRSNRMKKARLVRLDRRGKITQDTSGRIVKQGAVSKRRW